MFVERFLTKLSLLLRGTTVAPAARFGETLDEERTKGGSFFASSDPTATPRNSNLPNGGLRLYGGAQFNRAMAEFRCRQPHFAVSYATVLCYSLLILPQHKGMAVALRLDSVQRIARVISHLCVACACM